MGVSFSLLLSSSLVSPFLLLERCQSTRAQTITNTLGSKVTAVAGAAIDIAIGSIVQIRRVQRLAAIGAIEATLVPDTALADHLFGSEDSETATWATTRRFLTVQWTTIGKLNGRLTAGGDQCGGMSITEALGAVALTVTGLAVDIAIGTIASQHRVKGTMTVGAVVALSVPHLALGQLLFGSKDGATATGATLTLRCLNRCGVRVDEWATGANLILGQAIGLQETRAAGKAIAVGSPLLAIAGPAVDITIRTIAGIDGVQGLVAVFAIEALLVPLTALGELLLGGKDSATATWATLTGTCLNPVHLDGGTHLRCTLIVGIAIRLQSTTALSIAIALGSELLGIAALAVDVLVGCLAAQDRVQALLAGTALEALLVPATSTCQHLFGSINIAATAWATLTLRCLGNGAWLHASTVPHCIVSVLELCTIVHGQCAGTSAKAITLWSIFTSVADLAVQIAFMLCAVGRIQRFVAHRTLEAVLMEYIATCQTLLGSVYALAALRAFRGFDCLKGHLVLFLIYFARYTGI